MRVQFDVITHSPSDSVGEALFSAVRSAVRSSVQQDRSCYHDISVTDGLSNLDETYVEYSVALTDDLVRFWRSKVKGQGHSKWSIWRRHPRRRWVAEVHILL